MMKYQRLINIALILYSCLLTTKETYAQNGYNPVLVNVVMEKITKNINFSIVCKTNTIEMWNFQLFRNGDRTVDKSFEESYPNDPYKDLAGDGELTTVRSDLYVIV